MVNPTNSPFYEAPEAFNCVGMNVTHDPNLCGVIDSVMRESMAFQSVVTGKIISKNCAGRENIFLDHARECFSGDIGSGLGNDATFAASAFHDSDNGRFLFV